MKMHIKPHMTIKDFVTTHHEKKNGHHFQFLGIAKDISETSPRRGQDVVVYHGRTGRVKTRPVDEFEQLFCVASAFKAVVYFDPEPYAPAESLEGAWVEL